MTFEEFWAEIFKDRKTVAFVTMDSGHPHPIRVHEKDTARYFWNKGWRFAGQAAINVLKETK